MELLEWMEYKYQTYLCEVNLIKHEKMNLPIGRSNPAANAENESLKTLASDHQSIIDSLSMKIKQLDSVKELLETLENKGKNDRHKIEDDLEDIQFAIQKTEMNKMIEEVKRL